MNMSRALPSFIRAGDVWQTIGSPRLHKMPANEASLDPAKVKAQQSIR
jgi:hypothetical protein